MNLIEYLESLPTETLKALTMVRVMPVSPVSALEATRLTTNLRLLISDILHSKP